MFDPGGMNVQIERDVLCTYYAVQSAAAPSFFFFNLLDIVCLMKEDFTSTKTGLE